MSRHWTDEALWRYVDGRLSPADRQALEESTAEDRPLRQRLRDVQDVDRWLSQHMRQDVAEPATLIETFEQRLAAEPSSGPTAWHRAGPRHVVPAGARVWVERVLDWSRQGQSSQRVMRLASAALLVAIVLGLALNARAGDPPISAGWPDLGAWLQAFDRSVDPPAEPQPVELPSDLDLDHLYYIDGLGLVPLGPEGFAAVGLRPERGSPPDGLDVTEDAEVVAPTATGASLPARRRDGPLEVIFRALYSDGRHMQLDLDIRDIRIPDPLPPGTSTPDAPDGSQDLPLGAIYFRTADGRRYRADWAPGGLEPAESWDDVGWWGESGRGMSGRRQITALPAGIGPVDLMVTLLRPTDDGDYLEEHEVRFPLELAYVAAGDLEPQRARVLDAEDQRHGISLRALAQYRSEDRIAILAQLAPPGRRDAVWLPTTKSVTEEEDPARGFSLIDDKYDRLLDAGDRVSIHRLSTAVFDPADRQWVLEALDSGIFGPNLASLIVLDLELDEPLAGPARLALRELLLGVDAHASDTFSKPGHADIAIHHLTLPPRVEVPFGTHVFDRLSDEDIQIVDIEMEPAGVPVRVHRLVRVRGMGNDGLALEWAPLAEPPGFTLTRLSFGYMHDDGGWPVPLLGTRIGAARRCGNHGMMGFVTNRSTFDLPSGLSEIELCAMKPSFRVTGPWEVTLAASDLPSP